MQLWKRRALVLAGAGFGAVQLLMSSAGAQVSPPFPPTTIPEGFPTFPTFTLPPFTLPTIPLPTIGPTSSLPPPPTMPPPSVTTTTPPPTMPPFTLPSIPPPPTMPPGFSSVPDAESLAEEIFNRAQDLVADIFGSLFD